MGSALFADGAAAAIVTAREIPDGDRRRPAAGPLRNRPDPGGRGIHGLEHRRRGLRDGPGHLRPAHHRRPHHRRAGAAAGPRNRLLAAHPYREIGTGPSTRAAAASWTRCSPGWSSATSNWCRPGRRCATTGTCAAPRCCSCSSTSWSGRRPTATRPSERICSMAFGPGLTVETGAVHQDRPAVTRGPTRGRRGHGQPGGPARGPAHLAGAPAGGHSCATAPRTRSRKWTGPDCDPAGSDRTYAQFAAGQPGRLGLARHLPAACSGRASAIEHPATLLDIGSGGGDVPRMLARWAARDGLRLRITAIDPDPRASRLRHRAAARPRDGVPAGLQLGTGRRRASVSTLVVSNHVLHHLTAAELAGLLADSRAADALPRRPQRHPAQPRRRICCSPPGPCRSSTDPYIRHDGLTSIRRSYTPAELRTAVPADWRVVRDSRFRQLLVRGTDG